MAVRTTAARHPYDDFLHLVEKPARYCGGELHQTAKESARIRFCLAFPDTYEIGMSHLGTKILYRLLNDAPDISCERAFCPWPDMEAELRLRGLPLLSSETARPLREFDVVGVSLQFELTFTNILTMLSLGGIGLRASERGEDEPLVLGGGPCATHPEAVAPFFDAFLVGDAEERLPRLLRDWKADREAGLCRREALVRMAAGGGVYCPALYERETDPATGLLVVGPPNDPRVPARVRREVVEDLDAYPFPARFPVAAAEAVFDRLSVEVARGCTEGCRFCQAGTIYRPIRERSPESVVGAVLDALDLCGYEEASLTSLSTADYSCLEPLVRRLMDELRRRRVSLSVSSLRAYGLSETILDEIRSVRATGLTFAPEAGTQRMRDVVNKNVSDADIATSAERVFSRGWQRAKLYFMIGLPFEEDDDVRGIVATAARVRDIGRRLAGRRADVTASVSNHVPKPHTPFQWAPMEAPEELGRKQRLLRDEARPRRIQVKCHDTRTSLIEGIVARGDARVADVIEAAWRAGCRFDGWDDRLDFDTWIRVMGSTPGFDRSRYLAALPAGGRLPWDHIDVRLAGGFLEGEWERASRARTSPPCGKPAGRAAQHTNVADALLDGRKLVCYQCGVSCDLHALGERRIRHLRTLGALEPANAPEPAPERRPSRAPRADDMPYAAMTRVRLQYAKTGLVRLQGHRDLLRMLPRVFRRAGLPVGFTRGFHPVPVLTFSPALPLGYYSAAELVDVSMTETAPVDELLRRLREAADPGILFLAGRILDAGEPHCASRLDCADYLVALPRCDAACLAAAVERFLADPSHEMQVVRRGGPTTVDARPPVLLLEAADPSAWPGQLPPPPEGPVLRLRMRLNVPCPRPLELALELLGPDRAAAAATVRVALWRDDGGALRSPMEAPPPAPPAAPSSDA